MLRWNRDNPNSFTPDEFIPILESTVLIHEIGQWVIELTEPVLIQHNETIAQGYLWSKALPEFQFINSLARFNQVLLTTK